MVPVTTEPFDFRRVETLLFFPGSRPDLLAKAVTSGADAVCVDLEDAVPSAKKSAARVDVFAQVAGRTGIPVGVRINRPSSLEGLRDLLALAAVGRPPAFLIVPKVDDAGQLRVVSLVLHDGHVACPLVAMIESPSAVSDVEAMASLPGVGALLLGGEDLRGALGPGVDDSAVAYARSRVVFAAAAAGKAAIDSPWMSLSDAEGLRTESRAARRLGFSGKAAIHPGQVTAIQEAFAPTPDEVARAAAVVAAGATGTLPIVVGGRLIEQHALDAAGRILARSRVAVSGSEEAR